MEFKDYYATLGVQKNATDDEIKRAYRKLARQFHPDLNPGDKAAETKFKELNEANEVLGDPDKRRKYDELGANWREYEHRGPAAPPGGFAGGSGGFRSVTPEEMENLFGGEAPFSDFFSTFFGGGAPAGGPTRRSRSTRSRRGADVEAIADLTLEEAFAGTTRKVALGPAPNDRTVEVRIPAGIKEGARIRAAGEGGRASGNGAAGDLYLLIRIQPHPRFERRDLDLHTTVTVPITTAVLGGEATITTIGGSTLRVRIPELTNAGRVFRLRGHGMPKVGRASDRGDLYVTLGLRVPNSLTPEERRHYEALKALAGDSERE
jgi:DnaJ-class molecular chaperone